MGFSEDTNGKCLEMPNCSYLWRYKRNQQNAICRDVDQKQWRDMLTC
jgi:hypothetical protein